MTTPPSAKLTAAALIVAFSCPSPPCLAEQASRGIEQLMSAQEFQQMGLHKLTAAERSALSRWLAEFAPTVPVATETTMTATAPKTTSPAPIDDGFARWKAPKLVESRIEGRFNGWSGKTVFRLQNGQVWQQRLPGRWTTQIDGPEIQIKQNFLGYYYLNVAGSRKRVAVTRIQ